MKEYKFLDNSIKCVEDNTCRGCYLEHEDNLPSLLQPIWKNKDFIIRQDAECPIPGFFIISTRNHVHSFGDFSDEMAKEIGVIIASTRKIMQDKLGIKRVHIFLEERMIDPHFHIWLLPLWESVMKRYSIDPKIWNSNIKEYLELFTFEENAKKIEFCNEMMAFELKQNEIMQKLTNL